MTEKPSKPELAEYEEEETPLDAVLRRLLSAKPTPKEPNSPEKQEN